MRRSVTRHKPTMKGPSVQAVQHDECVAARLLATFPTDRATWGDDDIFRIANLRRQAFFFCPTLKGLEKRTGDIAAAAKKMGDTFAVSRSDWDALVSGDPLNLRKVLRVHYALEAIARAKDPKIRALTSVKDGKRAARTKRLVLGEGDVVPSHYWPNKPLLIEFCKHYKLRPRRLAKLIFGSAKGTKDIIKDLSYGFKRNGHTCDYRVTPYTCDYIYFALSKVFDQWVHLRRSPFPVMPVRSQFFIASHTAGADSGRRTVALPAARGNQMHPLTDSMKRDIAARVAGGIPVEDA